MTAHDSDYACALVVRKSRELLLYLGENNHSRVMSNTVGKMPNKVRLYGFTQKRRLSAEKLDGLFVCRL